MPMASPLILAHRGDATRARENTIDAFEAAVRAGADGIEFDVRASMDGLVVHHDPTVRIRGRRRALRGLDPSKRPAWIPTLEAVVAWARGTRSPLNVEIKEPGTETAVVEVCRPILDRCTFTSFHPDVVYQLREAEPRAKVGWVSKSSPEAIEAIAASLQPPLVVLPLHRCDPALLATLQNAGAALWAWNVNTARAAQRLHALGVTGLITDDVEGLVAWRDARAPPRTTPHTGRRGN